MKIGIVGSREWPTKQIHLISAIMNSFKDGYSLVSGGADGVDKWAESLAKSYGIENKIIRPDFEVKGTPYNKSDYYHRNKKICEESDIMIFFWDKKSPGTKLCLQALLDVIKEASEDE